MSGTDTLLVVLIVAVYFGGRAIERRLATISGEISRLRADVAEVRQTLADAYPDNQETKRDSA